MKARHRNSLNCDSTRSLATVMYQIPIEFPGKIVVMRLVTNPMVTLHGFENFHSFNLQWSNRQYRAALPFLAKVTIWRSNQETSSSRYSSWGEGAGHNRSIQSCRV